MRSINSLIKQLQTDYPEITFTPSDDFKWSTQQGVIFYNPNALHAEAFCLHELSHAILKHYSYKKDVELLQHERNAWEYAQRFLSDQYDVIIDEETAQNSLDTYRDWLHARSTCPQCNATGVQKTARSYHCMACKQDWLVNEARLCALRRYDSKNTP